MKIYGDQQLSHISKNPVKKKKTVWSTRPGTARSEQKQ
jgi:hypothetical protein